jgi:hypothetical protein
MHACAMIMPDFGKASNPFGLIDDVRLIEDTCIKLGQSCDLRFCLHYEKVQDTCSHKQFGHAQGMC